MYAQVCTRPDLAFITGMLGRYQSNPGQDHWKAVKKVLHYLQGTKDFMLTYRKSDVLEVDDIQTLILRVVLTLRNPHQVMSSLSQEELYH